MDTTTAKNLAVSLMTQHGVINKGWRFEWDNAKKRNGATHFDTRKITLSRIFAAHNTEATVRNTILHEIAHVLVGPKVKAHGEEWQRQALEIGCNAKRCTESAAPKAEGRYHAICEAGTHVVTTYMRRPGVSMLRGGYCKKHRAPIRWLDTVTNKTLLAPVQTRYVTTAAEKPKQAPLATKVYAPWVTGATSIDEMWGY